MAITGLRLVEAVRSYNLIIQLSKNNRLSSYNEEKEALEHFRYEELFLRKGKRMGLKQRFSDLRELHGSILTRYLSESEINFLHGRIGASVFMQNYLKIAWINDSKERLFRGIREIQSKSS